MEIPALLGPQRTVRAGAARLSRLWLRPWLAAIGFHLPLFRLCGTSEYVLGLCGLVNLASDWCGFRATVKRGTARNRPCFFRRRGMTRYLRRSGGENGVRLATAANSRSVKTHRGVWHREIVAVIWMPRWKHPRECGHGGGESDTNSRAHDRLSAEVSFRFGGQSVVRRESDTIPARCQCQEIAAKREKPGTIHRVTSAPGSWGRLCVAGMPGAILGRIRIDRLAGACQRLSEEALLRRRQAFARFSGGPGRNHRREHTSCERWRADGSGSPSGRESGNCPRGASAALSEKLPAMKTT